MKTLLLIFITTFIWMGFASTGLTQESKKPKCPQIRKTKKTPSLIKKKVNPLKVNEENLSAGKELFERLSKQCSANFAMEAMEAAWGTLNLKVHPLPEILPAN